MFGSAAGKLQSSLVAEREYVLLIEELQMRTSGHEIIVRFSLNLNMRSCVQLQSHGNLVLLQEPTSVSHGVIIWKQAGQMRALQITKRKGCRPWHKRCPMPAASGNGLSLGKQSSCHGHTNDPQKSCCPNSDAAPPAPVSRKQ